MSASDHDEGKGRLGVSRYAPRHIRAPREETIRPVLERLSRGLSEDGSPSAPPQPAPLEDAIHMQDAPPPKFPLSMAGRLVVAMGLAAVVAAASFTLLESRAERVAPKATAAAPEVSQKPATMQAKAADKPSDMPKVVRTVTLRPETTTATESGSSTSENQSASFRERDANESLGATSTPPRVENALALTAPLTLWAMYPGEASGPAATPADTPPSADETKTPERAASPAHRKARRVRHARRHSRARKVRTAASRPKPAPTGEASASQPIKKAPIQAALDAIFGTNGGGGAAESASGRAAPAPTGAAFQ